jgi:hypothetical protein
MADFNLSPEAEAAAQAAGVSNTPLIQEVEVPANVGFAGESSAGAARQVVVDPSLADADSETLQVMNTPIGISELDFDETKFKSLLAEANSVSFQEKMQIIQAVPGLKQAQMDSIMKVLQNEVDTYSKALSDHRQVVLDIEKQKIDAEAALEKEIADNLETKEELEKLEVLKSAVNEDV